MSSTMFNKLSPIFAQYAQNINQNKSAVSNLNSSLNNLESGYLTKSGILIQGFYPLANGTMGENSSAKMVCYEVHPNISYLITWLEGANKYRTAFSNTGPSGLISGSPIYDYVDNAETSHEDYERINIGGYLYLYVYIGNTSTATINSVITKVKTTSFFGACMVSDGDNW